MGLCGRHARPPQTLEQIGLLDEGLYTYYDDIDICLRASRAGWETWFVPESRVIHFGGASTGMTPGSRAAGQRSVSGPPAMLPEKLRQLVYHADGCGIHPRVCDLAAPSPDPSQARHRPPQILIDSFRHSIFRTGFQLKEVENLLSEKRRREPWRRLSEMSLGLGQGDVELEGRSSRG